MGIFNEKDNADKNEFISIEVKQLVEWNEPNGEGCIVSDMITKEGWKVGFMYRDEPMSDYPDSGWRFFKGDEDEEYSNNPQNHHVFKLNTICNYDSDIIPYLHSPIGTYLIRTADDTFIEDDDTQEICMVKQET